MSIFSFLIFFLFKQKTAYEMRISDWSSDVCSSDLPFHGAMTEFLRIARNPLLQHVGGERGDRHTRAWQDTEDRANTGPAQDGAAGIPHLPAVGHQAFDADGLDRSEERRVGKECVSTCRSRWSPDH